MRAVPLVLALALAIYALLDCARTPEESMPARMPKLLWIVIIVMVWFVGPIAWIIVSRVKAAEDRGGEVEPTLWSSKEGTTFRRPQRPRPMAPDDDPEFLRDLEQDIRRRKHHPQEPTGAPDASNDGADEDPEAGETGVTDRSGTDSH